MNDWGCGVLRRHPFGPLASQLLHAGLAAVDPRALTEAWARTNLPDASRIRVLAVGKAAVSMSRGLLDAAGERVVGGTVVTKYPAELEGLNVLVGGHPVPSGASEAAGAALWREAQAAQDGEVVVALVSGGASALAELPQAGVDLETIVALTNARLRDGTAIEDLNAERSALSRIKAGGLARAVSQRVPLRVAILSDVLGGDASVVGSGLFDVPRAQVQVLADNSTAVEAVAAAARSAGAEVEVTAALRGEARLQGVRWAQARMEAPPTDAVRVTVAGGETTVTVRGSGRGGRNQELALAAAPALLGHPHALLVTLGTDGEDGPTDAAGAAIDGSTIARALGAGVDPSAALLDNDAYGFFDALGDLLRPGPTGTNVCDLTVAIT